MSNQLTPLSIEDERAFEALHTWGHASSCVGTVVATGPPARSDVHYCVHGGRS